MQVIYWCTALLLSWSALQCMEEHELFMEVSTRLENTVKEFVTRHAWVAA